MSTGRWVPRGGVGSTVCGLARCGPLSLFPTRPAPAVRVQSSQDSSLLREQRVVQGGRLRPGPEGAALAGRAGWKETGCS